MAEIIEILEHDENGNMLNLYRVETQSYIVDRVEEKNLQSFESGSNYTKTYILNFDNLCFLFEKKI